MGLGLVPGLDGLVQRHGGGVFGARVTAIGRGRQGLNHIHGRGRLRDLAFIAPIQELLRAGEVARLQGCPDLAQNAVGVWLAARGQLADDI